MNRRQFLTFNHASIDTSSGQPYLENPQSTSQRNTSLTQKELAARFLNQATFGPTMAEIDAVEAIGFEAWIDQQIALPATETLTYMWNVVEPVYALENQPLLHPAPFRWAWWQAVMRNPDTLRQRVGMALSEIMVISTRSDLLVDTAIGVASFYDTLLKHALGNFRNLLFDVAVHPAMGYYLSHANNRRADPSINRFPDQNFAREVMQLFSIGLFELNQDGSRKKDVNGNDIPTYDSDDVAEFAKVFTGMTFDPTPWGDDPNNENIFANNWLFWSNAANPMRMYEQFHEPGEKQLLNGFVVPSGQTGMQDIGDAIDNLFNHDNVGPFIGRLLIQRLVKSNPSPGYISRVAAAFNDNGSGVRGDMSAVVRAILLDDEARNTGLINDPTHGMLREPFVQYTHLCRALELYNLDGEDLFYNQVSNNMMESLGQYPFASPSVFNFFSPDYTPIGLLNDADLVGPEFQLATSVGVTQLHNFIEGRVWSDELMYMPKGLQGRPPINGQGNEQRYPTVSDVRMNLTVYEEMNGDIDALLARLNLLFAYGSLSEATLQTIENGLSDLYQQQGQWGDIIRLAIILVVTCPEYLIMK
ncbi:MAG: DUF1800 domain-containing protein [Chloroflexota bacterium]